MTALSAAAKASAVHLAFNAESWSLLVMPACTRYGSTPSDRVTNEMASAHGCEALCQTSLPAPFDPSHPETSGWIDASWRMNSPTPRDRSGPTSHCRTDPAPAVRTSDWSRSLAPTL